MTVHRTDYDITPIDRPNVNDIPAEYRDIVNDLFDVLYATRVRNATLSSYYKMHTTIKSLGISIPPQLERRLAPVSGWAAKAVKARTDRQIFDGYVLRGGDTMPELDRIVLENCLSDLQAKVRTSAYVHGVAFYTVMAGDRYPVIRGYSAMQASALWDKDKSRIGAGLVLANVDRDGKPTHYVVHTPYAVCDITRTPGSTHWSFEETPHEMGRPLMDAIITDPDLDRPFGHSIITPEVMAIIDQTLRDIARSEIAAEFYTFPQRYIVGLAEDPFANAIAYAEGKDPDDEDTTPPDPAAVAAQKVKTYLGGYLALYKDLNGDSPTVGQFPSPDPETFTHAIEADAQRFSGATNVPLAQLGVLSNTYTSSEALSATNDPLVLEVERTNRADARTLETIGRMALAIERSTTLDGLGDDGKILAAFKAPSMPTLSSRADAWSKLAAVDQSIIGTRVFYENLGLDGATIDRLLSEKGKASIIQQLTALTAGSEPAAEPGES